ncbi:uncharacterized protein LOC106057220 [Biomphalaria glabrata]|uniref:Uncharacterized protein LOC106057220 n=1 Tax=Biomphalaria glabrata TaxID=6526 RepID=A0A2C9LUC9_BIOGL|nr:uncharacterized protein LOC106057220 [Biomphalaria glabrata]
MTDNIVRREVQRRDDPFGIPACFYWTIDEVADWVESIGYSKYKENFRSHFINGRKLLTVDACVLPKMGITHFGDILAICKHVRELLRIKRNIRSFNPYQLRRSYVSLAHLSGKYHPHLTYRQHAEMSEKIVNSRLAYFRKKNLYYSGWSMEPWWDETLKKEEKKKRDLAKYSPDQEDDKRITIGSTIQERLREAAKREMSNYEPKPYWSGRIPRKNISCPFIVQTLENKNKANTKVVGMLNWTAVKLKRTPSINEIKVWPGKKKYAPTYLPIVFHWKEMGISRGYEQSRIEKKHKCGYYQK